MNQTIAEAVYDLTERFPIRHLNPNDPEAATRYLRLYVEDLVDLPEDPVVDAIRRIRRSATFMPSTGEIRRLVIERATNYPSDYEAERIVLRTMADRFAGDGKGPWEVHPMILETVQEIGTANLRSDEGGHAFRRFRELYHEKRERSITDMVAGTRVLPTPNLPRQNGTVIALERSHR